MLIGRLTPPPRPVPPSVRAAALGGPGFALGTLVFAPFMALFCLVAGPSVRDLAFYVAGPLERVRGTVTAVEDTRWSQGGSSGSFGRRGVPIRRIHYRFVDRSGQTRAGVSFLPALPPAPGRTVDIEVSSRWPNLTRMVGYRASPLGLMILPAALFPLAGLYVLVRGYQEGRKLDRLLAYGDLAVGRIVSRKVKTLKPKKGTSERQLVHVDYEFEFTSRDGRRVAAKDVAWKHLADMAARTEGTVLYDPARPETAVFVEALSRPPEIGPDAQWQPAGVRPVITLALLVAAHASYVVAASWVYLTEP